MVFRYFHAYWPLDVRSGTMFPGREFQVTGLGIDDSGLRIEYRVVPPLPRNCRPMWSWEGRDESGTVYTDAGGAYGTTPDGAMTDGSLYVVPSPTAGRHSLRIRITPNDFLR